MNKICPNCKILKSKDVGFYKNQSWCKVCLGNARSNWATKNKKHLSDYAKKIKRKRGLKRVVSQWSNDEIDFLKDNYNKMTVIQISENLNRTRRSVAAKASCIGLKKPSSYDKFWEKVHKTDNGCWEWMLSKSKDGYGQVRINGKMIQSHRASYMITHGSIPNGLIVMHSCDNPGCVNPNHLSLGTHKDNTEDMMRKGRNRAVKEGR